MKKNKHILRVTWPHKTNKRAFLKKIADGLADSPLPEMLFISSFILERWWDNSDFSYPGEIILPIIFFSILTIPVFYLFRKLLGKGLGAHLAAVIVSYGLYSFDYINDSRYAHLIIKIIPHIWATTFAKSLVVIAGVSLAAGLVGWLANQLAARFKFLGQLQPYKILLFAIVVIFGIQLVRISDRLWDIKSELSYQYPKTDLPVPAKTPIAKKPDIYFLMPEDYADSQTLKDVNNYDNSSVLSYLSSQGFTNKQPVYYSNYPFTMSSLASNLAMNYFPEFQNNFGGDGNWQTGFPYRSVINNPPIAQVLKQNGYQYNQLSSWWDFSRINIKADTNPSQGYRFNFFKWHFFLSDLSRDMVNKSILSPWLKKGLTVGKTPLIKYDRDYDPRENLSAQVASLKAIANRSDKTTPQFTFGHFMVPHTPFIFDPDGSMPDYDGEHNDIGADEILKYSNQVAYFNTQIQSMVGYIRQHDPSAVILIQSDEGSYPPEFRYEQTPKHYYDPINLPSAQMKQKFSIFASYYLPDTSQQDINQQLNSPVNTFRFVLNHYLSYSLPILSNCNFATGNKFVVYDYKLVTDKLGGSPDTSQCAQYQ